jgi:hypothetical protein
MLLALSPLFGQLHGNTKDILFHTYTRHWLYEKRTNFQEELTEYIDLLSSHLAV